MSLNATPSGERVHIGFFGKRNAGKSSIVNAVTGQELAVVSDVKGTTTDPVTKAMELLPIGPVVIIDTPGIDDEGALGELRVKKTKQILNKTDIAVLVIDSQQGMTEVEQELVALFQKKGLKYLIVYNKIDLLADKSALAIDEHVCLVSAVNKEGIEALKEAIGKLAATEEKNKFIVADLIQPNDFVVLVTPIDSSAPKGRLILPQQQTIRDILDAGAVSIVTKETELAHTLENIGKKPALVITDSQAFAPVAKDTPLDIPLTSFSILMARYKGQLEGAVYGAAAIEALQDGDMVLISEGCTHHRQCGDIGTVKLPKLLEKTTGKQLQYRFTSGTEFPDDLSAYKLIIHCGGCMLNEREMQYRQKCAADQNIPFTNYGIAMAYMQGILKRSIEIFPSLHTILN
ncbi:MAG: [FeFe] hydrogenase H-cluster maturation GTPase HydF [Peptococcaceae bacterium]|nr:[FeFe] hydrogenase H-cluster maturation GTPase HydF [Peptococcaceae bacterium]MBO5115136.1 [FeFe] hydrogenase H-cluster maturation GTPase HydF [Peptococcaceae bacterium]MBQ2837515.1 [FeFe] hydrogenase H-cluster maturation GTPase HydF [Peptococcaceae bacterium]MBQ6852950.1 [FeFe] hydrogenase H-cluster maturation GTPase HydF [Peptococcaceae bacterium]